MEKITICNTCGEIMETSFCLKFHDVVGMAKDYTQYIGICPKCGLIVTQNPFSEKQLSNRYSKFSKYEFEDADGIFEKSSNYQMRSLRQKQFIERVISEKLESILEIGAASGYNLSLYDKCIRFGIEPSKQNCERAKETMGLSMFCGMFSEFIKQPHNMKYDLIFLSHVLEHIVNPYDFIKKCAEYNNRYIFIEVPTLDYKFIDEPYGMFAEEHVNIFTLESLTNLMNACGYRLVNADIVMSIHERLPAGWPAVSSVWEKAEERIVYHPMQKTKDCLLKYIYSSEQVMKLVRERISAIPDDKKIAIWGTGHHASMLLANTDLHKKNIVKVYDMDRRKQGQLFNGKCIQPFCREEIGREGVEMIVVATYTAQKVICKELEPYKNDVEILVLYQS